MIPARFVLVGCSFLLPLVIPNADLSQAQEHVVHEFERVRLTEEYFAEGAGYGDFDRDGKRDVVCGPFWFAGPDFKERHQFYDGKAFPNDRGYSDNFFSYVGDFNGDTWDDVLVVGLPGTPAHWYENSHGERTWNRHLAFEVVDNEAPTFADLTGDGVNELVCTFEGRLGYLQPREEQPTLPWIWMPISEKGAWQRYSHGLGVGDVDGDKRADFLMPEGWWRHPLDKQANEPWSHSPSRFGNGGAQIHVVDVDADGDNDVVTSLSAHAWGLSWYEQIANDEGVSFREHRIMNEKPSDNPYGVAFSQLHAIDTGDIDGDGRPDIVAGKCYWAHNGGDPGARDPAVIYWFHNVETDDGVEFVPHMIDNDSGVGRQIHLVDMNDDGLLDLITANKKGTFVFLHRTRKVTADEWERLRPKRTTP